MATVILKNKFPQAIPTLVFDNEKSEYVERRVPARGTMEVEEPLSSLTLSQIQNGVLRQKQAVQ